jgi:hypothetical protein
VFTARYALSPYIKQIRFVFEGLTQRHRVPCASVADFPLNDWRHRRFTARSVPIFTCGSGHVLLAAKLSTRLHKRINCKHCPCDITWHLSYTTESCEGSHTADLTFEFLNRLRLSDDTLFIQFKNFSVSYYKKAKITESKYFNVFISMWHLVSHLKTIQTDRIPTLLSVHTNYFKLLTLVISRMPRPFFWQKATAVIVGWFAGRTSKRHEKWNNDTVTL